MTSMLAQYVAATDPKPGACPVCTAEALVTEMHAIGDLGTVRVALLGACPECAPEGYAICAFCGGSLPMDGHEVWRHVRDRHADA